MGFPGGSVVKNLPANAGDTGDVGSIPELERFPGEGNLPDPGIEPRSHPHCRQIVYCLSHQGVPSTTLT